MMLKKIICVAFLPIVFYFFMYPVSSEGKSSYTLSLTWPEGPGLKQPFDIAVDNYGNIYITDSGHNRILKIAPSGKPILSFGFSKNSDSNIKDPTGIAIDKVGNIYVVDRGNHRIQKFASEGVFVKAWGSQGSGEGQFNIPVGIAIDEAGNIYTVERDNHRVQKFTSDGVFLKKWGTEGSNDGQFENPAGIAVDGNGNVYVTDMGNHRIQKFTSEGAFLRNWGKDGDNDGEFCWPIGIVVDKSGYVYVSDYGVYRGIFPPPFYEPNQRIQKFTSDGVFVAKWGAIGSDDGQLNYPCGVATDNSGNVYVADKNNNRIQKFTSDGVFLAKHGIWGSNNGDFKDPVGIAVDDLENIYVTDDESCSVQKFMSNGVFVKKWGEKGTGDSCFQMPSGIAVGRQGSVYVIDRDNHFVKMFTNTGDFLKKWGGQGSKDGQFKNPEGIAIDSSGNILVADTGNHRIQKFSSDGVFYKKWGIGGSYDEQFILPRGIAIDNSGNVYVADTGNHRIQKFTSDGIFLKKWGMQGSADGEFINPVGVAIDNMNNVYVADYGNHRIQKFTPDGTFMTEISGLYYPTGVALDKLGNVYIADSGNLCVKVYTPASNKTPSANNISISPALPKVGDSLMAIYEYNDADGDPEIGTEIIWYKNEVIQTDYNDKRTVPSTVIKSGEKWYFTVKPRDGVDFGEIKTSPSVLILSVVSIKVNQTANKGDPFYTYINVEDITNLAGFQFDISFDPSILESIQVEEGKFLSSDSVTFWLKPKIDNTKGMITGISCVRSSKGGANGSGILASVTFKARGIGEGIIKLQNVRFIDSNGDAISVALVDGRILVKQYPAWDVNKDGQVNILDFVIVGQHFGETIKTPQDPNPDVDGDGKVDILDFVLIGQHFGEIYSTAAPSTNTWNCDSQYLPVLIKMYEFMEDNPSSNEDFVHTKSLLYRIIASSKIIKTDILQNYPNPFNSETWIPYQLAEGAEVNLSIYDSTGRLVRIIDLGYRPVGAYLVKEQAIYWDGKANSRESVASGVYFYCIKAGKFTAARKMLILR